MIIANQCPDQNTLSRLRNGSNVGLSNNGPIPWPNVVVHASYKRLQKTIPESAFSIFTLNSPGEVELTVGGHRRRVCGQSLAVINPYESLDYNLNAPSKLDILNIHLDFNTYRQLIDSLMRTENQLLNDPTEYTEGDPFLNQLYFYKNVLRKKLMLYAQLSHEEYMLEVLEVLTHLRNESQYIAGRVVSQKRSTRLELLKRVAKGRDIIYSNYDDPDLSVDSLSNEVSMSKFHFIRVFKQVYSYTPYKLIQQIRIKKALEYLQQPNMSIAEIALLVGFQESNSIYPLLSGYRSLIN